MDEKDLAPVQKAMRILKSWMGILNLKCYFSYDGKRDVLKCIISRETRANGCFCWAYW